MAVKKRSEVIHEIEDHITKNGGSFDEWVIGMTDNPKTRLFGQHKLREKGDGWICRRTFDGGQAFEIVEYFRTVRQLMSVSPSANDDAVYVYAYRRKPHTNP